MHIIFPRCRVESFSLSSVYIKLINIVMIFHHLSCLLAHGIDYNSPLAQRQTDMMTPHGMAEVGSAWYYPFLFHVSTCLKQSQRTVTTCLKLLQTPVNGTRQVTLAAPALGKSISEGKIYPDVKNEVCTQSFMLKSRVKLLGVG